MSKKNEYNAIEKLAIIDELAAGRGTREEVARNDYFCIASLACIC
ncbi:hypothetical protein OB236_12205 [Paenibacillus sp. WQ 127069]|uniref:Transposase n=1 Tax=Paenibacillus baimaensis TaxID=2982185 RepID=A0ABT2UG51_9BACL|nr:hypothetical protein [Paenibacillus sp. WQ 127069]MCU6792882.1 hypothetical protein [Paenibacillus sp. WQ 127069]